MSGTLFVLLFSRRSHVIVMNGLRVVPKSWSAVGSHGQCRPAGGRPDDTLARGRGWLIIFQIRQDRFSSLLVCLGAFLS